MEVVAQYCSLKCSFFCVPQLQVNKESNIIACMLIQQQKLAECLYQILLQNNQNMTFMFGPKMDLNKNRAKHIVLKVENVVFLIHVY